MNSYEIFETISQIGIIIFGVASIWLIASKNKKHRKLAGIVGLISQIFWFYTSIYNGQWGIALVAIVYTISWIRAILNNTSKGEVHVA